MSDEKVRENRLRRMAARQGLRLVKSRRRDPLALEYERYALISENEYKIAGGSTDGRFGYTIDEVETLLSSGARRKP
jgi:hypothetical protein